MPPNGSLQKVKVMIGIGVVILVLFLIVGFKLMRQNPPPPSKLSIVKSTKGKNAEPTDSYIEQENQYNKERVQGAIDKGTTSLPILSPKKEAVILPVASESTGGFQSPVAPIAPVVPATAPAAVVAAENSAMQAKRTAMAAEADHLMLLWGAKGRTTWVANVKDTEGAVEKTPVGSASPTSPSPLKKPVPAALYAGNTLFGILEAGINTDLHDEVSILLEGDMKGGRAMGVVKREGDFARVTIKTIFYQKKSYDVTGVVMDAETSRGLLSGEVDHKIVQRYVFPFLAETIGAVGSAMGRNQSVTTVSSLMSQQTVSPLTNQQLIGIGAGAGVHALNNALSPKGENLVPSVSVEPGVAVGIRLLSDAIEKTGGATSISTSSPGANLTGIPEPSPRLPNPSLPAPYFPNAATNRYNNNNTGANFGYNINNPVNFAY